MPTALFPGLMSSPYVKVIGAVIAVLTIIPMIVKVLLVTVQIDEHGYFTRNGKPLINKKTGLVKLAPPSNYPYFVFPFVRQIRIVSTKSVAIDPVPQQLTTSDDVKLTLNMTASYVRLVDEESLTKSILRVENPTSEMYNIVSNTVNTLVSKMTYSQVREVESFLEHVLKSCNEEALVVVGAEFANVRFQSLAKTEAQLHNDGLLSISTAIGMNASGLSLLESSSL